MDNDNFCGVYLFMVKLFTKWVLSNCQQLSTQFMAFVPGRYQVCCISFLCLSWIWPQLVTLNHVPSFLQAFTIRATIACRVYWFDYTLFTGEVLGFENLVFSIFEFVSALVDGHKLSMRVESVLTDLLYYLILFMQITEEQVSNNNIMNFILWELSWWIWILLVLEYYFHFFDSFPCVVCQCVLRALLILKLWCILKIHKFFIF